MRRLLTSLLVVSWVIGCGNGAPEERSPSLEGFNSQGQGGSRQAVKEPDPPPSPDAGPQDAQPQADAAFQDARPPTDGGGGELPTPDDLGVGSVEHIAGESCEPVEAPRVELFSAANPDAPYLNRASHIGSIRVAGGDLAAGVVLWDVNAPSPSARFLSLTANYNLFAIEGSSLSLVGTDLTGTLLYQRFNHQGAPEDKPLQIGAGEVVNLTVAGGHNEAAIVWAQDHSLRLQPTERGLPVGEPISFAHDTWSSSVSLAAVQLNRTTAVAWNGDANGLQRTYFALVTASGQVTGPAVLTESSSSQRVSKVVARPGGFAVLLTPGAPWFSPLIVLVNEQGQRLEPVYRLQGIYEGWDMAATSAGFAIVGPGTSSAVEPRFRSFDWQMNPKGSWQCLDKAGDIGHTAAIDARDDGGYAVIYRGASGATYVVERP